MCIEGEEIPDQFHPDCPEHGKRYVPPKIQWDYVAGQITRWGKLGGSGWEMIWGREAKGGIVGYFKRKRVPK